MNNQQTIKLAAIFSILWLLILNTQIQAQTGGTYTLNWWTIDSGGGTRTGGDYTLSGTIGQPDTGLFQSEQFTLTSGFWPTVIDDQLHTLYLPMIRR